MRRLLPCLCLVLLGAGSVSAQRDYPKWDFTGAYTFNRFETPAPRQHIDMQGVTGAVGWNFRRWAAIEGDVTYTTKDLNGTRGNLLTFAAGPRFTKRFTNSPAQPFIHAVFGGGRLTGFSEDSWGWVGRMGGGVDIVAGKHIAIRAFQVDYYRYHGNVNVGTQRLNNMVASFGVRFF